MYFHSLEKISQKLHLEKQHILRNCVFLKNNLKKKKRIISLLQTPRPDPEGSMTGIMKAWTLEHWIGIRHERCLLLLLLLLSRFSCV